MLRPLLLLAATAICTVANDPQCAGYNHPTYGKVGQCIRTARCPSAAFLPGLCPSYGSNIKCCFTARSSSSTGTASSSCTVRPFTHTSLIGETANVEDGFRTAMEDIVSAAARCGVKVYVTGSFRLDGRPVGGAVVTPATSSNHHVGKAIDFNLADLKGNVICNSACLAAKRGSAACFINGIQSKGLTWGGNKARHVDDGVHK